MRLGHTIFLALILCSSVDLRGQTVVLQVPELLQDGEPLLASISIENTTASPLDVTAPVLGVSVWVDITTVLESNAKCVWRRDVVPATAPNKVTLKPGAEVVTTVDLADQYPLGLRPGVHQLIARYRHGNVVARSLPRAIEIVPSPDSSYGKFVSLCDALVRRQPGSPESALDFARAYPDHPYAAAVLSIALDKATSTTRSSIVDLLLTRYPLTRSAREAEIYRRLEKKRSENFYDDSVEACRLEIRKPVHEKVLAAFQQIGSIATPDDFRRAADFVDQFPESCAAAEALHAMAEAATKGIGLMPLTGVESRAASWNLKKRLADEYGTTYWGKRAAEELNLRPNPR